MANSTRFANSTTRPAGSFNSGWLRLAIVLGVFFASVFMALRAANINQFSAVLDDPLIMLLPVALVAMLLLRYPPLGLLGLVVAGLAIQLEVNTGTQTRLNAPILLLPALLGLALYSAVVHKRRLVPVAPRVIFPLLAFVAVAVLSLVIGQLPWFMFAQKAPLSSQLGGLAIFVLSAVAFLLVAYQVRDVRWLEWMTWIYLGLCAVHVIGSLIPGLGPLSERVIETRVYNNSIFWIWLVALAFSQAVFNHKLQPGWRLALAGLVLGALYLSLVRDVGWTSGWLPPVIAMIVILFASRSPFAWLALFFGAVMAVLKIDRINNLIFGGGNEYSVMTRLEAWRIIGEIVRVSPFFGLGPSNYYWYTPLFSILGYSVRFNSHNNYADLIAQTGLLGLIFFAWFVWELGWLGWRLLEYVPGGFPRAFVYGALGGLVATLVAGMLGDWFLPFVYNIGFRGFRASVLGWAFLGGLVALQQIFGRTTPQAEQRP